MIFTPEHVQMIVEGRKTQMRCVVKSGEELRQWDVDTPMVYYVDDGWCGHEGPGPACYPGRVKWVVGRTYAVQPGRGKPGAVWREDHNGNVMWALPNSEDVATFDDWTPLRIRITGIRQERLQDISEDDVVAEGHNLVRWASEGPEGWPATAEYAATWDRINTRKGTRWQDNPLVWALTFELVNETP